MNITIDQLLAKIGAQVVQIDLLNQEVARLQAQIKIDTKSEALSSSETSTPAA